MADYEQLWEQWTSLSANQGTPIEEFDALKDQIYEALAVAQSREERKELSSLLSTVQNKIWGVAKKSSVDHLTQVLATIPVPDFLRSC